MPFMKIEYGFESKTINYSLAKFDMFLGLLTTGKGRRVQAHKTPVAMDNSAVVSACRSRSSRNPLDNNRVIRKS